MTVSDLVARSLVRAGTRAIFGVPGGGSNLDLIEAAHIVDLPFVLTQTETGAALMASAQAEITGTPGACLCTLGPGVASIVNGVAHARLDRVPLAVFSDRLAPDASARFEHQNLPHSALLGPVAKRSVLLSAADAPRSVPAALAYAAADPPGPVHFDCPAEVAAASVEADAAEPPPREAAAAGRIRAPIARLLERARRPVLIAGLHARDEDAAGAIRIVAESRGVPVLTTYKAKGVIPDGHPLQAGLLTLGAIERPLLARADLLVTIGLDPVELLPRPWPPDPPAIHCARWKAESTQLAGGEWLLGDVAGTLRCAGGVLRTSDWTLGEIARERDRQAGAVRTGTGFSPAAATAAIAGAADEAARITVDAGAHMFAAMTLLRASRPGRILISNGLSTMGYAVPAGIGAALLDPEAPVIALTGDGGLLMCLGELATAARQRVRLVIVVFADRELSLIRLKQDRRGLRPAGVHLGDIDWTSAAAAFGFRTFRADDAAALADRIASALATGGPALVEARIDPAGYGGMAAALRG